MAEPTAKPAGSGNAPRGTAEARHPRGRPRERGNDEGAEHQEFRRREDVDQHDAGPNAQGVVRGERENQRQGERTRQRRWQVEQLDDVRRDANRHDRDGASADDEQERPAVEEADERVKGFPEKSVFAPGIGQHGRQLREHEGPRQGQQAAQGPRREDQPRGVEDARHQGGIDEDPAAHHRAHDDHAGAEEAELSGQGGREAGAASRRRGAPAHSGTSGTCRRVPGTVMPPRLPISTEP